MNRLYKILSEHKWLIGILAFALLMRIWGIQFGLPEQYHPDEVKYVILGLKVGVVGLNVGYFDNPTGYSYLLFFEYGLLYLIGRLFSIFHSPRDLAILYYQDPSIYVLLGRLTAALFGVGTVWLTYLIGKKTVNRTVGLLAALFLAVSFGHIRDSHYAVPDIPMAFFLILAFYCMVQFYFSEKTLLHDTNHTGLKSDIPQLQSGRKERLLVLLAGFFAGIAVGFKYTAGFIVIPIMFALLLRRNNLGTNWKQQLGWFLLFFVVTFIGFFIACPYALLDYPKFIASIQNLRYMDKTGHWGIDPDVNGYLFYLQSLNWQLGLFIFISGLVGIGYCLYKYKLNGIMVFLFPPIYYVFMSDSKLVYDRYMLPVLPFLCCASAIFIFDVLTKIPKIEKVILPLCTGIVIIQPLVQASYSNYLFTQKDTRTIAKEWVEQNIPAGSKIAMEGYGPPLTHYRESLKSWVSLDTARERYQVTQLPTKGAALYPLNYYREQRYDYLIIASYTYLRYWVRPEHNPEAIKFYESLPKETELIARFSPYRNNIIPAPKPEGFPTETLFMRVRPGPIIQIYKIQRN
ncbi:MAG: phospholipid carrier-dependent glycosyltransferase [bacterium]|nr:phospholipid carrier-dependent glycosyltransferase [bacterium]